MSSLATLSAHKLELSEAVEKAVEGLAPLRLKLSSVTAVSRTEDGWRVSIELVERHAVPDTMDLLGVYEVLLDPEGELVSYERIRVRRRCDLEERAG
jgi:hypothetical protein